LAAASGFTLESLIERSDAMTPETKLGRDEREMVEVCRYHYGNAHATEVQEMLLARKRS